MAKVWTGREILELRFLHGEGMRCPEMAAELGRSTASVRHKCQELNLPLQIGGSDDEKQFDPTEASHQLEDAINALIYRMSPVQVAHVLGTTPPVTPGTENVLRGQAAERRLAA